MGTILSYERIFKTGTEFEQIRFLDNFYEYVNTENEASADLQRLLVGAIQNSSNSYVKRSSVKILFDLTLSETITNSFATLGVIQDFLESPERELQVIALKYLHRFPDFYSNTIEHKVRELSDTDDGDVASQAYFCLGFFQLSSIRTKESKNGTLIALVAARPYFEASSISVENRVDADFYLLFIQWAEALVSGNVAQAKELLKELNRILSFLLLHEPSEVNLEVEYLIFQLVTNIDASLDVVVRSNRWLDVRAEIDTLFQISLKLKAMTDSSRSQPHVAKRIRDGVLKGIESLTYQQYLGAERPRLEELRAENSKLSVFISHILNELSNEAVSGSMDNPALLALLVENIGYADGLQTYESIQNRRASPEVMAVISSLLQKNSENKLPFRTGSDLGQELLFAIMREIHSLLPDYSREKLSTFSDVLEEVIRYARTTFIGSDRSEFSFLYSLSLGGKGATAAEDDLQESMLNFFRHSKISDGLEHEKARFVDGGRVDILYKTDIVTIPIELKKTDRVPDQSTLEANYIAQAQTYTAGYDQLGLFVLLELSDKSKKAPPNFKDWFHIHHLQPSTQLPVGYPDYVVSVVIPGNRTTPHKKSTYV